MAWLISPGSVVLLLFLALPAGPVLAQDDAERARSLFKEGVASMRDGDWTQAEDQLRSALALKDSPVIRYNLALSLEKQSKFVEAETLLKGVIVDPGTKPSLLDRALEVRLRAMASIATLKLSITGELQDVALALDGEEVQASHIESAVKVNPGVHVLTATRDGREVARAEGSVAAGTAGHLALDVPAADAAAPTPTETALESTPEPTLEPDPFIQPSSSDEGGVLSSPWFWMGTGALVAGAVVVAVLAGGNPEPKEPTEGNLGIIIIGAR